MMVTTPDLAAPAFLATADLDLLIQALRDDGRKVIGPRLEDGAITYDEIGSASDLPIGWRDQQAPGRYRIAHDDSDSERARRAAA